MLEGLEKGVEVKICGILTGVAKRRTKEGKQWASMSLEDCFGAAEAMLFSTNYDRLLPMLDEDKAVLVRALVLPEDNAPPKLSIQDITPLDNARVNFPSLISIKCWVGVHNQHTGIEPEAKAEELNKLFARKQGPTEIRLRIERPKDFSVVMDLPMKVRPDREFTAEVKRICGNETLEVLSG
jgi:DNA polymerase-3 subunit alpha